MENNKLRISLSRILLSGLFVIVLLLIACGGGTGITTTTPPTTTTPTTTSETPIHSDYKTYTSEGLFSISYPSDWLVNLPMTRYYEEELPQLITSIESDLPVEDSLLVFYAGVPTELGDNPGIVISVGPLQEVIGTLDSEVELMMEGIKDNPEADYSEFSQIKTTIDGREAVIVSYQWFHPYLETPQHNLWMITLIGKTEWLIGCTTSPEMFSDYEEDFYAIVNSFCMLIE